MENSNINTVPYQPKPLFQLEKHDIIFAICAVVLGILLSVFGVFGVFGGFALGYLFTGILTFLLFAFYFKKHSKYKIFPILCGLLSLAINAIFITTSNGSIRFFGAMISFALAIVYFDNLINGKSQGNRKTADIFYSAFSTPVNTAISLKSLFSNKNGNKQNIGKALVGLVCAIPVLLVIVPLLISSDDAFRGMMSNIFKNTFSTIIEAIFGIIFSFFIISYGFSLKYDRASKIPKSKFKGIENVYLISFLSAIGICYLLYLFSQLAYFFSAFSGFLPEGEITYAQYARKGFFEMCIIAVINLIIVFLNLVISKKKKRKVCLSIRILTTFISVFTLIIITTAISKMVLYIDTYGMTELRITTSAFMLFLSVVFICVILKIHIAKINILKTALITAGCIILTLGTVNVNAVCAKYNYESFINGKLNTIDINALYELGDEGIPYIIKLASHNSLDIQTEAQKHLANAYLYDYFNDMYNYPDGFTTEDLKENQKKKDFKYFSVPQTKAYKELYEYIERNPWFANNCQTIYENNESYDETQDIYY